MDHCISSSSHPVVIPEPEITSRPHTVDAEEGDGVTLSCTIRGFQNSTQVQWRKDSSIIDTTGSQVYHVSRRSLTEKTFIETLSFFAESETEGQYTCCVGYRQEVLANLATVDQVSEELECGVEDATVAVSRRKGGLHVL